MKYFKFQFQFHATFPITNAYSLRNSLIASFIKDVPNKECKAFVLTHLVQTQWQVLNAPTCRDLQKSETNFLKREMKDNYDTKSYP